MFNIRVGGNWGIPQPFASYKCLVSYSGARLKLLVFDIGERYVKTAIKKHMVSFFDDSKAP